MLTSQGQAGSIVVVGSINVDLIAHVHRHPLPGETLHGRGGQMLPGGKGANQAVAAARLGGKVAMVGAVGTDAQASVGLSGLQAAGVDLRHVSEVEGPTGLAVVTVAQDGENSIVVIPGANATMGAQQVTSAAEVISRATIVVCQGEIPREGIEALPGLVTGHFLHNPAPVMELDPAVLRASDPLVVNEHEAALVLAQLEPGGDPPPKSHEAAGSPGAAQAAEAEPSERAGPADPADPAAQAPEQIIRALREAGIVSVVLTLGAQGSLVADTDGVHRIPPARVEAVDTTGAGDAFIGALAMGLARGDALLEAALLASRVGAFAAAGRGAQPSYPGIEDTLPEPDAAPGSTAPERTGSQ